MAIDQIKNDKLAVSVARAVAVANEAAIAHGVDIGTALVTIAEESAPPDRSWRIHYGPRDYVLRRGGDFTVVVDDRSGDVKRIVRGQ